MGVALLIRFARALRSRLFHRNHFLVLAAPAAIDIPRRTTHADSVLLRINGHGCEVRGTLAEEAMRVAGEPPGLVDQRLAHGDEFFGWLVDNHVVSFGWASYRERAIGCHRLKDAAGRVFLYNFYTNPTFRKRGLYAALLLAIRHVLGNEGISQFIIDVERHNGASINAIGKAGFTTIAHAGFGVLFSHWRWPQWHSVVAGTQEDRFAE